MQKRGHIAPSFIASQANNRQPIMPSIRCLSSVFCCSISHRRIHTHNTSENDTGKREKKKCISRFFFFIFFFLDLCYSVVSSTLQNTSKRSMHLNWTLSEWITWRLSFDFLLRWTKISFCRMACIPVSTWMDKEFEISKGKLCNSNISQKWIAFDAIFFGFYFFLLRWLCQWKMCHTKCASSTSSCSYAHCHTQTKWEV